MEDDYEVEGNESAEYESYDETNDADDYEEAEEGEVEEFPAELESLRKQLLADYTRKTQHVAGLRKEAETLLAIEQIAEYDPEAALQAFAQFLARTGKLQFAAPEEDDEDLHPYERKLHQLERVIESREQEARNDKLEASIREAIEVNQLRLDVPDLLNFMLEAEIGNPMVAAELVARRKAMAPSSAVRTRNAERKASLPPVAQGGSRLPDGPGSDSAPDIDEALAMARKGIRL